MGHVCAGVLWACLWDDVLWACLLGDVLWACLWGCHLGMSVGGCPESMYYIEPLSSGNPLKWSSLTDLFNCNLNILCARKLNLNGPLIPNQNTLSHTGWDSWPIFTIKIVIKQKKNSHRFMWLNPILTTNEMKYPAPQICNIPSNQTIISTVYVK